MGRGGIYAPWDTLSTSEAGLRHEREELPDDLDQLEVARGEHAANSELFEGLVVARWGGASVAAGPLTLLPLATIPMAVPLWRTVCADGDPRRLNPVLRGTARLTLVFALLFTVGLVAGRW